MDNEDYEFILDMMEIEHHFENLSKHDQIRVEKWCKKLCIKVNNQEYRKNRDQTTRLLLINTRNNNVNQMFKKSPPEGPLPMFDKTLFSGLNKQFASQVRPHEVIKRFEEN
jgi:hypothetical protein